MTKKMMTIVGARPQFIKLAALSPALRKYFDEIIVHTGQHYDYQMSHSFFEELNIPHPHYNLEVGSDSALKQIAKMIVQLDEIFEKEKPDCVIVFGDTNSTVAGALAAAKHQVKLAHVEAGLREFNKAIPEETNKLVTDILTDFYFCPTDTGVAILKSMGITENVYNIGDVMIDLDFRFLDEICNDQSVIDKLGLKSKQYYFATCHRASNTNNPERLKQILEAFVQLDLPILFPLHPRTKKVIEGNKLDHYLRRTNIRVIDPLPYLVTQKLIYHAKTVLTDSGGVTKEAYFFKVPGVILDTQTEWVETVREGWNQIIGYETDKIVNAVRNAQIPEYHSNCLGDGHASEKITQILKAAL